MKVTRIAPANQGLIRFESKVTYGQLVSVSMFDPEALIVRAGEGNKVVFQVNTGKDAKIGKYGMTVAPRPAEETITTVFSFVDYTEEAAIALASNAKTHLVVIEGKITKALAAFAKAKEDITEV